MCTVILAWINSKYEKKYRFLFVGTLIIDAEIIKIIGGLC